ncbi:MAG: Eco57I restriction-modification methylase domain-containing protein, partial [Deltaproteobacteria bacterium]|nr:Eco57I restriction-modification methylase domain-containing protein [Deltaproteobacteria bacterium]
GLCGITILDPACGSGSFLVGMLHILDDIQKRAQMQIGIKETSFERKKRIIGESLYGVDVMDWACHIAELRLWLALIIDAEFTTNELNIRQDPLLPHFTFKIRYGDSLKQEVGGINLGHTARKRVLSPKTRNRITALKHEKMKFFNNDSSCKFRTEKAIRDEELKLFDEVLDTRSKEIKEEIKSLDFKLQRPFFKQIGIDGAIPKEMPAQLKLEAQEIKNSIEKLEAEHERVSRAKDVLKSSDGIPPFVWDVSFVEIFEGEKEGFDIVIGNPPYVRQENISDPFLPREKVTAENKKEYKAKLMRSVYGAYPDYFGYDENRDNDLLKPEKAVSKKLDAKSDLYIYFYLHGLSLLNDKGSFCFITSNSWLDVGYGAELQEFLLKNCHVKMAIDNQVKRSFANADVNTVIALFSAPCRKKSSSLDKTARFPMFKVPFTYALSPVIFEEIEGADERRVTQEYRIYPVKQEKLLADGCEMPDEEDGEGVAVDKRIVGERRSLAEQGKSSRSNLLIRSAKYIGNKWGGKYLRAPDIYWTILEKGKGKLVRLGDIADVRFGIKTGANEFFYLDEDKIREWGIEKEFLKPVIKSPKECKGILINPKDLKFKIFMCHKDRKELKGTNALKYIEWGERQGFDGRPSCRGRQRWWECTEIKGNIFWVKETNDRLGAFISQEKMLCDCRLYFADGSIALQNSYNSTITALISEVLSRGGLGEGAKSLMVYEVNNILVLNPSLITELVRFTHKDLQDHQ